MEELTGLTPESILNEDIMMGGIFIEFVELFTHNIIDGIIEAILIWCRFEIISGQKIVFAAARRKSENQYVYCCIWKEKRTFINVFFSSL